MTANTPSSGSGEGHMKGEQSSSRVGPMPMPSEEALKEFRAHLQLVIDGSRHPIFIKDLQFRYIQINRGFEQLLGLPKDKIIGHTGDEILPPDVAAAYQNLDLQALVVPGGVEAEVPANEEDGHHILTVHKFPLRDSTGRIYAILGFGYDITDRKRAEKALQQSEERFRQLAENISEVFWINDPTKRQTVYVSPAYEKIWGRTCESLIQSPLAWLDAVHPDDRQRVSGAAQAEQTTGEFNERYRIVRPDGSTRWIHARAFPLRNARGELYRVVGIASDITELQRIQDELGKREEQYREVFAAVTEGLIIREWEGSVVEANPAFCGMLGYTHEEVLGLKDEDMLPPEFLPLLNVYKETVRSGVSFPFVARLKRKNGTLVPVEAIGSILHYDGRLHILDSVRDITSRTNAEEARRKSEADFRVTFENAPIGIALVAPDGHPIICNLMVQKFLGYSESELQNMAFKEYTYAEDVQADVELYGELMEGKRDYYQIEKRFVRKGGDIISARLTVSVVRAHTGTAQYAIAMVEDVTEKKKLEEQFLRAQRLESVGMLAGGIAHDLNNILAPMLMAGSLLRDKLTEPRDQAIVTMIEQGAQRGAAIIRQLLTFSRGLEGTKGNVQVRHLIDEMVQIIQETFPRNIEVDSKAPAGLWVVKANASQLHQVLMNLCVNARDAMPNGGRLSLTAANTRLTDEQANLNPLARPGRYVVVTVADTGHGIPKEVIDRIFEPFFTTKDAEKGTGLGLSTVTGIVKSHGGFVTVYSEPEKGSQFKVYLPVADEPQAEAPAALKITVPHGHGELILLVDDEAPIREAIKQVLEAHGYRVVTAANGAAALRMFIQHRGAVQLVLTDMMMPIMDGAHLIRSLRILEPKVRVIAMSGLDSAVRREELDALGLLGVVAKPFESQALLSIVRRTLDEAKPSDPTLPKT